MQSIAAARWQKLIPSFLLQGRPRPHVDEIYYFLKVALTTIHYLNSFKSQPLYEGKGEFSYKQTSHKSNANPRNAYFKKSIISS